MEGDGGGTEGSQPSWCPGVGYRLAISWFSEEKKHYAGQYVVKADEVLMDVVS